MRKFVVAMFFLFPKILLGQNVGIGTANPKARLHIVDSSVLFSAQGIPGPPGNPPASGPGRRMMWYSDKAAFRAGFAESTEWNIDNIGLYSFASGYATMAKGMGSAAFGQLSKALGSESFAGGFGTTARGNYSVAFGVYSHAKAHRSIALGSCNDSINGSNPTTWVPTDPLLIVGNGEDQFNVSNAMMILKNGNVGLGGSNSPTVKLHIAGSTDASYDDASGLLVTGNITGTNMVFDNNEILARNNNNPSDLYLNISGGDIIMASDGLGNVGIGTSTPTNRLVIESGNIQLNNSLRGIILNGADQPLITRSFDPFTAGGYTGLGRWGLFMEPSTVTMGFPYLANKGFAISSYFTNSNLGRQFLKAYYDGNIDKPRIDIAAPLTRNEITGSANLIPFAYGTIDKSGSVNPGSTNNFTASKISTGLYELENLDLLVGSRLTIQITPSAENISGPRIVSYFYGGGILYVYSYDHNGNFADTNFSIIIYCSNCN